MAWLAAHPPDQVLLVVGNHDLARVGELVGLDQPRFTAARAEAAAIQAARASGNSHAEHAFLARYPCFATTEVAARDLSGFSVEQRAQVVALLGGLVLPGAGMYYAGHKKTIGQYPRSAAFVTLLLGLLIDGLGDSKEADSYYAVAGGLYVIGAGIDIAMTPGAVADYNARRATPLAIAPIAVPGGGGLAVGGAF